MRADATDAHPDVQRARAMTPLHVAAAHEKRGRVEDTPRWRRPAARRYGQ